MVSCIEGGAGLRFDINNLAIDLDYVFVVSL